MGTRVAVGTRVGVVGTAVGARVGVGERAGVAAGRDVAARSGLAHASPAMTTTNSKAKNEVAAHVPSILPTNRCL